MGGANPHPEVQKPEFPENKEPVCWHTQSAEFYASILVDWQLKGVVDFCTVDLAFPLTEIQQKTPYVGVLPTTMSVHAVRNELIRLVWKAMQDAESPLYENGLADLLMEEDVSAEEEEKTGSKKGEAGKGKKGKGGGRSKGGGKSGKGGKDGKGGKGGGSGKGKNKPEKGAKGGDEGQGKGQDGADPVSALLGALSAAGEPSG